MPAPKDASLSTDHYLYEWIYNPLSEKLCFLNPNHITIVCFLMVFPILYGLRSGWGLPALLALTFVRQSLDCLDGAVARSCNKRSRLGAILDMTEDVMSIAAIGLFVVYMLRRGSIVLTAAAAAFFLFMLIGFSRHLVATWRGEELEYNKWERLFHDNTVIAALAGIVAIHWALRKQ